MSNDSEHPTEAELLSLIQELSDEFDQVCQQRHELGEQRYGAATWVAVDTLEMAIQEVVDLANYARYSFIKLRLLQLQIAEFQTDKTTAKKGDIPGQRTPSQIESALGQFLTLRKDQR